MTLHGGSSSAIIRYVFIQRSDTGPRERSWTSSWEWRRLRRITRNSLSGKRGAAHLANLTKPVLVIADNASSEAQVRPLMPGGGPHKVLVTSRHILAGLGARLIDLTILDDGASVELLDAAVRAARPGDDRVRGDQKAAGMLAELCSGLPLALQIIAALLNVDPTLSARELAGELAVETERLERLHYDDGAGPDSPSVATAFELSYRRLEQIPSRVFRLLPMNPGPDISTTAAAYLADLPVTKVRKILAELARAHLVEAAPGAAGRWRMHDLLHLYSRQLSDENAEADGREQGIDRLLGYYLTRADAADQHLRTQQGKEIPGEFADRGSALTWLDAERACLIAAVSMAADKGRDQVAMRLPLALAEYLQLRRRLDDWLAIATKSTEAARRLGDRRLESSALVTLSNVLRQLRHFQEAITICQNAVAICRETGDQLCEAGALNNLAGALHETGRLDEAITVQQENLVICRALSDRRGEGKALNNLGLSLRQMGKLDEAVAAHQNAAGLYREMGDRYGVGTAMNNLGIALQEAQRFEEAVVAYQEDLAICQEIGDRYGEATTLNNLGAALGEVGRLAEAIPAFREAAALYGETGERRGEGRAKIHLGVALRLIGLPGEAITVLQEAAAIFQETGDQESEGTALGHLDRISSGGGPDSGNTATSE